MLEKLSSIKIFWKNIQIVMMKVRLFKSNYRMKILLNIRYLISKKRSYN